MAMNGEVAHTTNGSSQAPTSSTTDNDLSQLRKALDTAYDPHTSPELRQQATALLDEAKHHPQAPTYGFQLAIEKSHPPTLRHYGLSMLEFSIKYVWDEYNQQQADEITHLVIQLARSISPQDPTFLRNKIAQLWTELAKRSWGDGWMDMDHHLVAFWETSLEHRALVLYILETLSEDIFIREDAAAGVRGPELGRACVDIFVPQAVLQEHFSKRETGPQVRSGDQGWIMRLCEFLGQSLGPSWPDDQIRYCAIRSLGALRAATTWVMPKAISVTHCVDYFCQALESQPDVELKTVTPSYHQSDQGTLLIDQAAVEALQAIYGRQGLHDDEFLELVCPMYSPARISMFTDVYNWSTTGWDVHDLDEAKYTLCKKVSELLSTLTNFVEQKPHLVPKGSALHALFSLSFELLGHPSLTVSIPILHSWTKLLRGRILQDSEVSLLIKGPFLEICSQRLVRYEALPEDCTDITFLFLNEDFDTVPERHAFIGNYRRYCVDMVEIMVRRMPLEAIPHILVQADTVLKNLYQGQPPFSMQDFSKGSPTMLRAEAQITVIDAALKGYLKWLSRDGSDPQQRESDRNIIEDNLEQWCSRVLATEIQDPELVRKIIQLTVAISTKALPTRPSLAGTILEYIINIRFDDNEAFPFELERKLEQVMSSRLGGNDRRASGFKSFLFIINQRSTPKDEAERLERRNRLEEALNATALSWQNSELTEAGRTFDGFLRVLGLDQLPNFFSTRQLHRVEDWSAQRLDAEGQALQNHILEKCQTLPLRQTKHLLAASTEKVREDSQIFETACELWSSKLPSILQALLPLIAQAQAFHNMDNWSQYPEEMQLIIRRVLTDRFWQAGISSESRDDFFARVSESKTTFEGFASTADPRDIFFILYGMSRFRDFFYGIPGLPQGLSEALYNDAHALSTHHLSVLLSMSTNLIEQCPVHLRPHFLPPVVAGLVSKLDMKISAEWDSINTRISQSGDNDNLGDEMKAESILRQLTFSSLTLVSTLLDYPRTGKQVYTLEYSLTSGSPAPLTVFTLPDLPRSSQTPHPMYKFILATPTAMEPLLLFLAHALTFRDTRSCSLAVRILRGTLPHYRDASPVRDFLAFDPYFVDVQKDLAGLIAQIIRLDAETARG
ncbi:karyopherin [Coniosporium tulheliwenetii]|uniref:Karyopherin n=1 Tax=Coniosporium tulheliwenetii TaxID=3383036 RepID=A0ACC2ZHR5_9PEZI|nr:karyopherin [Cladosporium sp. JES 115]